MPERPYWINDRKHDRDIARFVIQDAEYVSRIVRRAARDLRDLTGGRHGTFFSAIASDELAHRRGAIKALYKYLRLEESLKYKQETRFDDADGRQFIRLPDYVDEDHGGTCLDLVLLFLSCVARIDAYPVGVCPIYVHLSSVENRYHHGVAGIWLEPRLRRRGEFLEPNDVRDALAKGIFLPVECMGFSDGNPVDQSGRELDFERAVSEATESLHDHEIVFALDIRRAWETGVQPWEPPNRVSIIWELEVDSMDKIPLVVDRLSSQTGGDGVLLTGYQVLRPWRLFP